MKKLTDAKIYGLSFLAALLILVSGFSYWLGTTIFNEEAFTKATVEVMTSEETTENLSSEIVDKALQDNPVVKKLLGDKLESVVNGLLSTETFEDVVTGASQRIHTIITTKEPKGVVIDTTGIKSLVGPILTVVAPEQKEKAENLNIPDEIVIVDPDTVPSIAYLANYIWLWPVALLGSIGILSYLYINSDKKSKLAATQKMAGMVALTTGLAAIIIPSIEPAIVKNINSYNLKVIVGDIYQKLAYYLEVIYVVAAMVSLAIVIGIFIYNLYQKWQADKSKGKSKPKAKK